VLSKIDVGYFFGRNIASGTCYLYIHFLANSFTKLSIKIFNHYNFVTYLKTIVNSLKKRV
jgi:hypothetical protein